MGTAIVFVPEVFSAPMATALVLPVSAPMLVPVAVSVNVCVVDLVRLYPEEPVPLK
jgi:hypothetical protein